MKNQDKNNQIIIYNTKDGETRVEVQMKDETVWLSQKQMAELFDKDVRTINEHIKNIFSELELVENSVIRNFRIVQKEGSRAISRDIEHYNLDVIISVGYRVKSLRGTQFRIWATQKLKEYIVKGFVMDDERLKGTGGGNYWKELLDRIRDIRSSEKALYRQVLDLYATSVDYDPHSSESIVFFKVVQNKLHYATNKLTAAETIAGRADAEKDFMGLTTFAGVLPVLSEVAVAKNYLTEDELFRLNRMVSAFFDLAEIKAKEKQKMRMADWVAELDKFAENYGKGVLKDAGAVSHEQAIKKAAEEYKKYQAKTLSPVEKAYLENIKLLEKKVEKKIKGKK
jgi:hypothetical protein